MALRPNVKERIIGTVWAAAWMWPLISPAIDIAQGKTPHPAWAGLGLAAFVACYLVVVVNGFDVDRHRGRYLPGRTDLVLLGVLTAVGITLFATFTKPANDWPIVLLYVAVAGAATFTPAIAGAWTISVVMLTLSWAIGGSREFSGSGAAQLILGMLMAGALVQVVKQMQRYNKRLRQTRGELARNAVSEERLRFARDLHDLLGHTMSLIVVKAEVIRRLAERDPALAAQAAADIENIGRRALTEVREAVDGYRAPDFMTALDGVRGALSDSGVAVRLRHDGPPVPPNVSQVLGWVVREAGTNVLRHSGARETDVHVTVTDADVTLEIRDDGRGRRSSDAATQTTATGTNDWTAGLSGRDVPRLGAGLIGLRERVTAAGGTFSAGNARLGGFRVVATLPRTPAGDRSGDPTSDGAAIEAVAVGGDMTDCDADAAAAEIAVQTAHVTDRTVA